jgi:hypothetical protein
MSEGQPSKPEGRNVERPRCGLCGKSGKLTRTPCCGNWICDDADEYVPFSYSRNSCFTNHAKYTICALHRHEGHEGRWQDCAKCRENGPLEMYVHSATNEYNFEKLENPPKSEPTHCSKCGKVICLSADGYTMRGLDEILCESCGGFGASEMIEAIRPKKKRRETSLADVPVSVTGKRGAYPVGTVMIYGPDNKLATKLVASVVKTPNAEADPLHRWVTHAGDVRHDPSIQAEVEAFFQAHGVRQTVRTERIVGCPHEEGVDYPLDGACPHCPFWHTHDRFTHELLSDDEGFAGTGEPFRAPPKVGRNDPCPCGSGKKYKKCCGR